MMRNLLKKKSAASVRLPPLADESRAGSGAHSPAGSGSAQEEPAERPGESPAGSPLSPSRRNASFKLRASGAVGSLRGAAAAPAAPAVAIDVLGNLLFLQGKLKELTDMLGGFEGLRLLRNSDAPALVEELRKYLCAEDGTSDIIRRGLALNNASRHRLDVDHPRPEEALLIMQQPALAHLQRFPVENEATIIETWMREPAEFLLASVVLNFLRFLEHESKGSRELHTVVHLVDALVETVRGVLVNRAATMEQEPAMVWGNMMASCRKFWASRPEHSDAKYRAFVVMSWCEERERDVLAIMEDNVEERADNASRTPLWGTLDAANVRLRVCTPMFNFMDFVVDFLDFSYGAGYVFKPSTRPPAEWGVDEVVEWFLNLRMAEHVEAVRQCGVTGEVLLEMTKTDLDVVLGVTDPSQRTKLFMGLESLRVTSRHEMMPKLKRQGRKLVDLVVPDGMKGGGKMVVQDPGGHNVEVHIPRRTADQVEVMRPGMKFQHVFTYSQTVLNKWQLAGNQAMRDAEPGVVPKGQARTGRNLWKGAIRKIKIMNKLESRINKVLRMSATDETVRLAAMDFFPKEAAVLRDFLLVNVSCKRLEISYNNFGPEGCTSVCQALMDNRTVAELRFSSNRIGDRGALEVARLIKTSNALMEVDLGNNLLTDASGVALLQAASTSPPDRDVLGHRIEGSHTLKRLMLYNNRLGPDTFHAWAKSIKRHPVLEVDLSENEAGDQGVAYVAGYIAKCAHPQPRRRPAAQQPAPARARPPGPARARGRQQRGRGARGEGGAGAAGTGSTRASTSARWGTARRARGSSPCSSPPTTSASCARSRPRRGAARAAGRGGARRGAAGRGALTRRRAGVSVGERAGADGRAAPRAGG
jgi:hypothetical protein